MPRPRKSKVSVKPECDPYPDPHSPTGELERLSITTPEHSDEEIKPKDENEKVKEKGKEREKDTHRRGNYFTPEIRRLTLEWMFEKVKDEHLPELRAYLAANGHEVPHKSIYKQFLPGGGLRKKLVAASEGGAE